MVGGAAAIVKSPPFKLSGGTRKSSDVCVTTLPPGMGRGLNVSFWAKAVCAVRRRKADIAMAFDFMAFSASA